MPADEIVEGIFRFFGRILFELILESFCYGTGRALIWTFTFGRVTPGPPKSRLKRDSRKWNASRSNREVDAELATLIGLLFWVGLVVLYFTLS